MVDTRFETELEYGRRLAGHRYFHAALEIWKELLASESIDPDSRGLILDNIGDIHRQLGDYSTALSYCSDAARITTNPQDQILFRMHVAVIYRRLYDIDRASRLLMDTLNEYEHQLNHDYLGKIHSNLGMIQGAAGFYNECLDHMSQALQYFQLADMSFAYPALYNNLGLLYFETGEYDKAEENLLKTLDLFGEPDLALCLDLSRLYFKANRFEQGAKYLRMSLSSIWTSIMDYSKEDIAALCELLASVAYESGDTKTAMRLIEKAQLFAGQIGKWQDWEDMQIVIDEWTEQGDIKEPRDYPIPLQDVQQFLNLMDIMNGQEFLNKQFSRILDTRVIYAEALSEAMHLSRNEQEELIYACRFADYGLTALEMDVIENPKRSSHTWEQFTKHPELSVTMLEILQLPSSVTSIIADHHENFDGSGYPNKKKSDDIPLLARVFAVVDQYTWSLTNERRSHSEALKEIKELSGIEFDPTIVETFENMFQI